MSSLRLLRSPVKIAISMAQAPTGTQFSDLISYGRRSTLDPKRKNIETEDQRKVFPASAKSAVTMVVKPPSPPNDVLALSKVEVKLTEIPPGKNAIIKWRGKPLFVRHRTQAEVDSLIDVNLAGLRAPGSDSARLKRSECRALVGKCTHLRGVPIANKRDYNGFYCPCNGLHYDAFKLFKLDDKMAIDESKLKREMFALQKNIHPDKFIKAGPEAYENARRLSSLVNELYDLIKHPYKRAKYLLSLRLHKNQDEIESMLDKLQLYSEFLYNMLNIREIIGQTQDVQQLSKMSVCLEYDFEEIIRAIDGCFECNDFDSVSEKLGRLKCVANVRMALKDKLGAISDSF